MPVSTMKNTLATCLKVFVSCLLAWLLLRQIGLQRIWEVITRVDRVGLCAAVLVFTASHFLGSAQWRYLLHAENVDMPFVQCLSIYFVGLFFNNFLVGGIGGDVFRILDVRRISKKSTSAVSAVFLDRLMGFLVMSGISVISIPFALRGCSFGPFLWISFAVLIGGWCFSLFFLFNKPFARFMTGLIRVWIPKKIEIKAVEIYNKIHGFGRNRALFLRIMGVSTVVQVMRIITHYLLALALGVSIPAVYFFLIIPIIALAASLPISFGGIGLREQTGVVLLGAAGMTSVQAVSVEFLAYLVAIISSVPGGLIFIKGRRKGKS